VRITRPLSGTLTDSIKVALILDPLRVPELVSTGFSLVNSYKINILIVYVCLFKVYVILGKDFPRGVHQRGN
jgi:hypothetical protein